MCSVCVSNPHLRYDVQIVKSNMTRNMCKIILQKSYENKNKIIDERK
jgi:hypothetical protein